ncbi:MAG: alpha-L-rhamnosidase N-terminal domain-containing protein [Clostridia bacterium]|nr:alpha-L-rhamnosidase N-terminal domain-containing protein [Clostridia bacterium]
MDQTYYFKNALWLGNKDGDQSTLTVLRGQFNVEKVKSATLRVLGLGFFKCYINGHCINPDTFLPLSSDYEPTPEPKDEVLSAHRNYVPEFEIGQFLVDGDNTIEIRFGGGWYCHWTHT